MKDYKVYWDDTEYINEIEVTCNTIEKVSDAELKIDEAFIKFPHGNIANIITKK